MPKRLDPLQREALERVALMEADALERWRMARGELIKQMRQVRRDTTLKELAEITGLSYQRIDQLTARRGIQVMREEIQPMPQAGAWPRAGFTA